MTIKEWEQLGKNGNKCWVDVHCDYLEREEEN